MVFFTGSTELLLPITIQLSRCCSACQIIDRRKTDVRFQHRLVRLQNQQACVSDWRLLAQFSMICQGDEIHQRTANADYMLFVDFVNSRQTN